jgi:hypothetical protein
MTPGGTEIDMAKKEPIVCVVDADYLRYNSGFACEHPTHLVVSEHTPEEGEVVRRIMASFDNKREAKKAAEEFEKRDHTVRIYTNVRVEPISHVHQTCKAQLKSIKEKVAKKFERPVEMRVYLTGTGNFRERVATIRPYKGNRDPAHKPLMFGELTTYLTTMWEARTIQWMEADDFVSMLLTEGGNDVVVAGIDKDLLQVPGWHFNPIKDKFVKVTPKGGLYRLYVQIIQGDTTDNIAGAYKYGEKGATEVVQGVREEHAKTPDKYLEPMLWQAALGCYEESLATYGSEKCGYSNAWGAAVENARLVYMLREYPEDPSQPDLWLPPTHREPVL